MRSNNRLRESQLNLRAVETRDGAAVEFCEQVFAVDGNKVDELTVKSLFLAEGFRIGNGGGRELSVAPTLGDVAAQVGGRFVDDFFTQRIVDLRRLSAKHKNGRGGARVGAGSHRRNGGGKQDKKSGRSSTRSSGCDVGADRNLGGQDCLDNFAHRGIESTRGVHRDENQ